MNLRSLLLLAFYLFSSSLPYSSWLKAQSPGISEEIQFETITIPGGKEANMANQLMQDSLGFLWLTSQKGLHRYDGTNFRTFPLSENSKDQYTNCVIIDKEGNYWAASYGNGLFRFDPVSGDFEQFLFKGEVKGESPNNISQIVEGPDGKIWAATANGILAFNPNTKNFEHYSNINVGQETFELIHVESTLVDSHANLWFGAGNVWASGGKDLGGLLKYIPEKNNFEYFDFDRSEKTGLDALNIGSLYEDSHGKLWIGTSQRGLYSYDPNSGVYQKHNIRLPELLHENQIVAGITEDCYGRLWLAITYGGFYSYDPQSGTSQHFLRDPARHQDIYANNTWKIMTSRNGSIWLVGGTATPGINKFDPCPFSGASSIFSNSLSGQEVTAITQAKNDQIWIGTNKGNLYRYHSDNRPQLTKLKWNSSNIKTLHHDQKGKLWVGCWSEPCGLKRFHPETGKVKTFSHDPADPNSLSNDLIMDILEDKEGKLWIATWGGGLNRFDPDSEKFTNYKHDTRQTVPVLEAILSSACMKIS